MKNFYSCSIISALTYLLLFTNETHAQNSLTGDGFGGRMWYVSHNYQVGSYSGYTVCDTNNQLYAWGENFHGELGNGTTVSTDTPVLVSGMDHVKFYTTGYVSTVIKDNNTAWVWGTGSNYSSGFSEVPQQVLTNVKFADGGTDHVVFVKFDGTVWGAGLNDKGQLGNGTTISGIVPVQMSGINNAVRAVALGYTGFPNATLILLNDSTVKLTGGYGQFTLSNDSIPLAVSGLSRIVDIKGGSTAAYALNANGEVYSFGKEDVTPYYVGTLGLGSYTGTFTPPTKIVFPTGTAPIIALSANNDGYHALALDSSGRVYGWGNNTYGQLGVSDTSVVDIPRLLAFNVKDIFAGETFSYILKKDNTLWASGASDYGSIIYGSIWMNLSNVQRNTFTQLDPTGSFMHLCIPRVAGTLPIQLINFSCTAFGSTAKLSWKTGIELNFSRFILEYSKNGKNFETLAIINTKASYSNYVYEDKNLSGTVFYRLKMIDIDGTAKYSDIRSARFGEGMHFKTAPNPTTGMLYISSTSNTAIQSVQVLSVNGQILKSISTYNSRQGINIHELKGGTYLIKTTDHKGFTEVSKVIKM